MTGNDEVQAGAWATILLPCKSARSQIGLAALLVTVVFVSACSGPHPPSRQANPNVQNAIRQVQARYSPADHMGLYRVAVDTSAQGLVLTGIVDRAEAQLETLEAARGCGVMVTDRIKVLPVKELGDRIWGIACLSVSSGREQPEHKAEMGTQVLMGREVRVLQPNTNGVWYLAETPDGYPAWIEKGTFVRCTFEQVQAWTNSSLLIVTAFEALITEEPRADAAPVSDVVTADLVKKLSREGDWYRVELPDGRTGFLPKTAAEDYRVWLSHRQPTAENIEHTARTFLGRPYLWGGNSPKGFDCSGFTKMVFYLNGVELGRNATHQALQGRPVMLDAEFSQLRPGDLLFFGRKVRGQQRIHHVAIYLGNKRLIHSSERVQINSLDPSSPIRDELRIRTLLGARRVLGR